MAKYQTLVKRFEKLCAQRDKLNLDFVKLREDARASDCEHTLCWLWKEDRDDGYGKWWKIDKKKCKLCDQEFYSYGTTWEKVR